MSTSPASSPAGERPLRILVAGATGVIGTRLVRLLVESGYHVAGVTRTPSKGPALQSLGAVPIICDVYDAERLVQAVTDFAPHVVVHQLTDLPTERERVRPLAAANARIRREGTLNLVAAAEAAGASRLLAQSTAWPLPGDSGQAVADLEQVVLSHGGTILRYGQFYGPGTFYESDPPPGPRVHIDEAARRTVLALNAAPGILEVLDPA